MIIRLSTSYRPLLGVLFGIMFVAFLKGPCSAAGIPFAPGEKLTYVLRWENIPAGKATLEVHPIKEINGESAYHFVMTAQSNKFVDFFYKIRDRIDAYADIQMHHSVFYQKKQSEGPHKKDEAIEFDWEKNQAQYTDFGKRRNPIKLESGSFDPLSAFYFTRVALTNGNPDLVERPITDGKKNIIGRAKVIRRETITLNNGKTYDAILLEPEMRHIGGVFKESKGAKIHLWVTADERCIPIQIKSKVSVGHFIGELIDAEGLN